MPFISDDDKDKDSVTIFEDKLMLADTFAEGYD
jgi:hypothetical protein